MDGVRVLFRVWEECKKRGNCLLVLPPRSPKLNDSVDRTQRTRTEEFYYVYNYVKLHQPLNYKTSLQYLKDNGIVNFRYLSHLSHRQLISICT